ncbi:protein kinase domain-containing protein [Streptomyces sp. BI20]|uniref:serine/threonine-protein kinase n=1 Tax=Streptomyces sp. BI20 TaxID=3403460 RepID=UPI003C771810
MRSTRAGRTTPEYAGQYRLAEVLGTGGMGTVRLAVSASGLRLAVKVVHAQHAVDPEFRARFRQEIAAARRVSGAFTAPVVDADPDADRPWMATLYIEGPTLSARVRERVLDARELARLGAGLAEGLRDIHRARVVHRDLKPGNVMMAADGPKVIDFGISRPWDSDLRTETGKLIGTPPFMAPEQFQRPREVGPAADVFALGAVLVYAATGRGPFDSESPYIVAYQVVHDEPELSGVPEDVAGILELCLAKEPADRPTPDELIAAFRGLGYPTDEETRAFGARAATPAPPLPPPADEVDTHRRPALSPAEPPVPRPRGRRGRLVAGAVGVVLAVGAVAGALVWTGGSAEGGSGRGVGVTAGPSASAVVPWAVVPGAGTTGRGGASGPVSTPACGWFEGGLFCAGAGGAVSRLEPVDGRVRWTAPAGPERSGAQGAAGAPAPLFAGGSVLAVPGGGGELRALAPADGAERWRRPVPVGGGVAAVGAVVLVSGADGRTEAVDAGSGRSLWTRRVGGPGTVWLPGPTAGTAWTGTPAAGGGGLALAVVDLADGRVSRSSTVSGRVRPIGVAGGALVLTRRDGAGAVDAVLRVPGAAGGSGVRSVLLGVPVAQGEATVGADGIAYLVGAGGTVAAVGPERELWRLETGAAGGSRPVWDAGRVFLGAADGRLLAVADGRLVGQTDPRLGRAGDRYAGTVPAPVTGGGRVFGGAPDGSVFAVDGADPAGW